jgi:hypothetical protein
MYKKHYQHWWSITCCVFVGTNRPVWSLLFSRSSLQRNSFSWVMMNLRKPESSFNHMFAAKMHWKENAEYTCNIFSNFQSFLSQTFHFPHFHCSNSNSSDVLWRLFTIKKTIDVFWYLTFSIRSFVWNHSVTIGLNVQSSTFQSAENQLEMN